jgi:hypothetical protein
VVIRVTVYLPPPPAFWLTSIATLACLLICYSKIAISLPLPLATQVAVATVTQPRLSAIANRHRAIVSPAIAYSPELPVQNITLPATLVFVTPALQRYIATAIFVTFTSFHGYSPIFSIANVYHTAISIGNATRSARRKSAELNITRQLC